MAIVAQDPPLAYRCPIGSVQLRGQTVGIDLDGELDLAGVRELQVALAECQHDLERDAAVRQYIRELHQRMVREAA